MPNKNALLFAIVFAVIAFSVRFMPVPANVAAMGALCVFAGCFLKTWQAMLLSLGTMLASDVFGSLWGVSDMGMYTPLTMLCVYGGYFFSVLVGKCFTRVPIAGMIFGGMAGSVAFFVVSNFGAWLDPRMGYVTSVQGLTECYVMAIPFYKFSFFSDILFTLVFFGAYLLNAQGLTRPFHRTAK